MCKIGIKFEVRNGTMSQVDGYFWLIKHYNYNNRPIYYNYDNKFKIDLHLYYGKINIPGKGHGWIVDYEVGWINIAPPILFHESKQEIQCPENIGSKWQTKHEIDLPDVQASCI